MEGEGGIVVMGGTTGKINQYWAIWIYILYAMKFKDGLPGRLSRLFKAVFGLMSVSLGDSLPV